MPCVRNGLRPQNNHQNQKNMANFTFTRQTHRRVLQLDLYEVEAGSYDEAVRKIQDNDGDMDAVGKFRGQELEFVDEDRFPACSDMEILNQDGVCIQY